MRADVAITPHARYRKAALPTPSEPVKLLDEKAAGRSCRRCARPDLHIAAGAPAFASSSRGPGATSNKEPALPDRPPAAIPACPKAGQHCRDSARGRMNRPNARCPLRREGKS